MWILVHINGNEFMIYLFIYLIFRLVTLDHFITNSLHLIASLTWLDHKLACWLHPEKPKLFWRLPLTVCGHRPAPHLQSNKFKGKKIAGSLHMVVPWPPTTVFPSVTAALKKKQKNNIFRLHLADSIEALPTESSMCKQPTDEGALWFGAI